jgi:hypothetical protein
MTVNELRLALADYPPEALVQAVDGVEVLDVRLGGSATEVLHLAAQVRGLPEVALAQLEGMLRLGPEDVYLERGLCSNGAKTWDVSLASL